jgi:predicted NBD/HSP70 family sugar kinase
MTIHGGAKVEHPISIGTARPSATVVSVRTYNQRTLLLNLLRHQPVSRIRLARLCGLSTTTVTNLVSDLLARGVVRESGTDLVAARTGAGRPPLALQLVPGSRVVLGIHIGVRRARLALSDVNANLLAESEAPLAAQETAAQNLARIAAAARTLISRVGDDDLHGRLLGVGVGASGLTDVESGTNVFAPNLGWRNVPIRAILSEQLQLPVTVDNNVRCMALAESLYGAGRNVRSLVYVYGRMAVGAGLVVDGELYRGAGFGAGEIGHWTMLPRGGKRCRCGNSGCLETLISEPVLVERARQVDPYVVEQSDQPLQAIFAAARRGHAGLRAMLSEQAFYLGIALANLVNVVNPHLILLGGLLHEAFDLLQAEVEITMRRHAIGDLGAKVTLLPATYGEQAGEIGAAVLALDHFFFRQPAA